MGRDLNHVELGRGISQRKDGTYEARSAINTDMKSKHWK